MPPPDSNRTLSADEKQILDRWIEQGAPYQGHWAFDVPVRPTVPAKAVADSKWNGEAKECWSKNPIDAFIAAPLIDRNWDPSPPADSPTLLRRVSMTLTGLLPPLSLQDRFAADPSDQAYEDAAEELLGSMAYAEHQTLRWLDAARYADTDGYQNDFERTNWPWRDWVIKAFHENMPFDQFTIQQLAGDMLPEATQPQKLATAFNRNHRQNAEGGALAEEFAIENAIDRVETTSTIWLGLTMGCCRCHDHKYDRLSQREFYRFYGYFNNIGEKGIGRGIDANPTMASFSPMVDVDPQLLSARDAAKKKWAAEKNEFEQRMKVAIEKWSNREQEQKSDQQQSDPSSVEDTSGVPNPDPTENEFPPNVVAALAVPADSRSKEDEAAIRKYFESIDQPFQRATTALSKANSRLQKQAGPEATVMVMRERKDVAPIYLLNRGQYDQPATDEPLTRGIPNALFSKKEQASQPKDRLELARWLVSRDNPLTARVIVNRIWQDHFGVGLVKTSDDFGLQGERPSHPELLDWLAVEFIESGWDLKALHRLIVTSAAYRQSSRRTEKHEAVDPENRLIWRGPRYRADGFTIRDVALQAAGLLCEKVGGRSVKPYQPNGLWETLAADAGTRYQVDDGESLYRKSMYTYWKRAVNPPRQTIFDASGREVCNVQARRTNTPLQALVLMNDPTFVESARNLAQRALVGDQANDVKRIGAAYRLAIGHAADKETLVILNETLDYYRKHFTADPDAANRLLSVGASSPDQSLKPVELASMTAVAHLILNLDEFVTVE
jgi:hypothetical protein